MTSEFFKNSLSQIEIRWPFKLFEPTFELIEFKHTYYMKVILRNIPHRETGKIEDLPEGVCSCVKMSLNDYTKPEDVWKQVYSILESGLRHELRESFFANNIRLYDPHKGEL